MEITFCELKTKQVVNVIDGKQLGNVTDLVINTNNAKIMGLIVPGSKNCFNIFKSSENIFIPYQNICKLGEDVILVEVFNASCKIKGLSTTEVNINQIENKNENQTPENN